jgi:hypothetical protein
VKSRPDAAIAYVEIERIGGENGGKATADAVVAESKPKDSPLHECFEWNNKSASHKWRLHQAREIMNSIEVTLIEETDEGDKHLATAPAFVSIEQFDPDGGGYRSTTSVMDNPELREKLIKQAWRDLESWMKRYELLTEFATVHTAIRDAQVKKPKKKAS